MGRAQFSLFGLFAAITLLCVGLWWGLAFPQAAWQVALKLLLIAPTMAVLTTACWFSRNRTRTAALGALAAVVGFQLGPRVLISAEPFHFSHWDRFLLDLPTRGLPMAGCALAAVVVERLVSNATRRGE